MAGLMTDGSAGRRYTEPRVVCRSTAGRQST